QLVVYRHRRESLTTVDGGEAVGLGDGDDGRIVDAVSGWGPVVAPHVPHEVRVRISPLKDGVIRTHHRGTRVYGFVREERSVAVVAPVGGHAHPQGAGLAV